MNPDEQAWRRHTTACRWMQGAAIRLNANCRRAQGARAVASRRDGRLQKSKQEQDGRRNDQQDAEVALMIGHGLVRRDMRDRILQQFGRWVGSDWRFHVKHAVGRAGKDGYEDEKDRASRHGSLPLDAAQRGLIGAVNEESAPDKHQVDGLPFAIRQDGGGRGVGERFGFVSQNSGNENGSKQYAAKHISEGGQRHPFREGMLGFGIRGEDDISDENAIAQRYAEHQGGDLVSWGHGCTSWQAAPLATNRSPVRERNSVKERRQSGTLLDKS